MVDWEEQHWSGRRHPAAGRRPKLKPNLFARLARVCHTNSAVVLAVFVLIAIGTLAYASFRLSLDVAADPQVTMDPRTAAAQAELQSRFAGIDESFVATVSIDNQVSPRSVALTLAETLSARPDLFAGAFVPGSGPFYEKYGLLLLDTEVLAKRIEQVQHMQPLFLALAASPNLQGLATLVGEIGKAVEAGRSPAGLSGVLRSVSSTVEAEIQGITASLDWLGLSGLTPAVDSRRWFVIATPQPGMMQEAASFARAVAAPLTGVTWLWPRQVLGETGNMARDFVIPGALSVVTFLTLLAAGLGSLRLAAPVAFSMLIAACGTAGVTAILNPQLDSAAWALPALVASPALVMGIGFITYYSEVRGQGASPRQAAMRAAHSSGNLLAATAVLFAAFSASWTFRDLPSLSNIAFVAVAGTVIAALTTFLVVPAALAVVDGRRPPQEPHWADDWVEQGRGLPRPLQQIVAMIILAAGVFCAAFLPSVKFGETLSALDPPPLLETPDSRGAIHVLSTPNDAAAIVSQLSALPETGSVRWAAQFLPLEAPTKLLYLKQLDGLFATPVTPPPLDAAADVAPIIAELDTGLRTIAEGAASDNDLREAAHRLRRAFAVFVNPEIPSPGRILALENALFSRLSGLPTVADGLSKLAVPSLADLDVQLGRRFVASDGTWRIEVMPRPEVGTLSFAAAVRRLAPSAAGEPIVALSRNEVIHHEATLAFGTAIMGALVLSLAALRDPARWLVILPVAGVSATFAAAALAAFGIALTAAMLLAASCAAAVCIGSAILFADGLGNSKASTGAAYRVGVLPPLVLLGSILPLTLSGRGALADFGGVLSLFLVIVASVHAVFMPGVARWLRQMRLL